MANSTKCKICGNDSQSAFSAQVLGKYKVGYFHCSSCGFIQTEDPFWIEEAYKSAINFTDTGYVLRNLYLSRKTLVLFAILFGSQGSFVDYAGGFGVLTRLMRDYGLDFYWYDLYAENIFTHGFEYHEGQTIGALTCFECFEHLAQPVVELEKILKISKNVFFSTRLLPEQGVPSKDWEYYGFEHGQHIAFYSLKTLKCIAAKYKLNLYSDGKNLHLLTHKKINLFWFRFLLWSVKFQSDLLFRKFLRSKTASDQKILISRR